MKPHRYLVGIIMILVLNTCNNPDLEVKVPDCIAHEIKVFKNSPMGCPGATVIRYDYQGEKVYVFEPGNCGADMPVNILNADCQQVCTLDGFTGDGLCNDQNFYGNATHGELVWKNQ